MKRKCFIAISVQKNVSCDKRDKKSLFLWILLEKLKISNLEMWKWDFFVTFLEKVTCTIFNK